MGSGAFAPASMTLSSGFNSPSGASPQTTASRTVTVPAMNSGSIYIGIVGSGGISKASINGGAFNTVNDADSIILADTQTLAFKLTGATKSNTYTLIDDSTGETINSFSITTT